MSTIKVSSIKNASTDDGGIAIDGTGHVQVDGLQMPTAGALSNRNLIINGAMNVAQRGTSFTGLTSGTNYSADRFIFALSSSGTATLSQSTDAPVGFKNSFKVEFTAAAASPTEHKIEYRCEGQDLKQLEWGTANAKGITISFYIKSNKTGNTQFALQNSANDRSYIAPFSINSANTWERKTIYVPGDTSGTWLTGNDIGLRIRWGFYNSSRQSSTVNAWQSGIFQTRSDSPINFADTIGNTFLLTGVQLEVGEKATPFEHRSYGDELARCQRYYWRGNLAAGPIYLGNGTNIPVGNGFVLPVTMRTTPAGTIISNVAATNSSAFDVENESADGGTYKCNMTVTAGTVMRVDLCQCDAEL